MAVYHYTGGVDKSPFHDIHAFKAKATQRIPGITDQGVSQLARQAIEIIRPRHKKYVVAMWGRDIMTEDLEGLWFWGMLTRDQQMLVKSYPLVGGQTLNASDSLERKKALLSSGRHDNINRSVIVTSHDGFLMQRTVVFCQQTDWKQEISDNDAAILLSYRQVRHLLVREDRFTGYNPVTSYSHIPVKDREERATMKDMDYLIRQFRRSNAHSGVDVPPERT